MFIAEANVLPLALTVANHYALRCALRRVASGILSRTAGDHKEQLQLTEPDKNWLELTTADADK